MVFHPAALRLAVSPRQAAGQRPEDCRRRVDFRPPDDSGPANSWPIADAGQGARAEAIGRELSGAIASPRPDPLPWLVVAARPPTPVGVVRPPTGRPSRQSLARTPAGIGGPPAGVPRPNRGTDPPAAPIPVVVRPDGANRDRRPEGEQRLGPVVRLVSRDGIVRGHVDDAGLRGLDRDVILPALRCRRHGLLWRRLQRPRLLRLGAQLLDHRRDVLRLTDEGVAEVSRPLDVVVEFLHHVGKARKRLHRWIPLRIVYPRIVVLCDERGILLKPAISLNDLERIGAGRQHLREQPVGIERDRSQEVAKLLLAEGTRRRRRLARGRGRRRVRCLGRRRRRSGWRWRGRVSL